MQVSPFIRPDSRTRQFLEAGFWTAGLLSLAIANPEAEGLFSLCPFDALASYVGASFCPGCGLGHAVGHLARGHLQASLASHPLAIPTVGVLAVHIARLLRNPKQPS